MESLYSADLRYDVDHGNRNLHISKQIRGSFVWGMTGKESFDAVTSSTNSGLRRRSVEVQYGVCKLDRDLIWGPLRRKRGRHGIVNAITMGFS